MDHDVLVRFMYSRIEPKLVKQWKEKLDAGLRLFLSMAINVHGMYRWKLYVYIH